VKRAVAVALLAVAACGRARAPGEIPAPAPVAAYRFGWDPPCGVPVTETVSGGGHEIVVTSTIHVVPGRDGRLEVYRDAARAKTIDGAVVGEMSAAEQRSLEGAFTLPRFEISAAGAYLGVGDLAEYRALMVQVFVDSNGEGSRAYATEAMSSPGMHDMVDRLLASRWSTSVESWAGWSVAPGERSETTQDGVTATKEHLGMVDGRAHLRVTERAGGETVSVLEVETDPATLRPTWARSSAGGELRETRFDWAHAIGCGMPAR